MPIKAERVNSSEESLFLTSPELLLVTSVHWAALIVQLVKNLPAMQETPV